MAQALTYCDMTTGPDGEPVNVETRLAEIVNRYGEGHVVAQAMTEARAQIEHAALFIQSLMAPRGSRAGTPSLWPDVGGK